MSTLQSTSHRTNCLLWLALPRSEHLAHGKYCDTRSLRRPESRNIPLRSLQDTGETSTHKDNVLHHLLYGYACCTAPEYRRNIAISTSRDRDSLRILGGYTTNVAVQQVIKHVIGSDDAHSLLPTNLDFGSHVTLSGSSADQYT